MNTAPETEPAWNEEDSQGTDEIVCPYCGSEIPESREFPDSGTLTCDDCEKLFDYSRDVTVTYCTRRRPE